MSRINFPVNTSIDDNRIAHAKRFLQTVGVSLAPEWITINGDDLIRLFALYGSLRETIAYKEASKLGEPAPEAKHF